MGTVRIFGHYLQARTILLGACEFLIVMAIVDAAAYLRFPRQASGHWAGVLLVAVVVSVSLVSVGLYDRHLRAKGRRLVRRLVVGLAAAAVLLTLIFHFVPALYIGPGVLGPAAGGVFVALLCTHALAYRNFENWSVGRRILIYGAGHNAADILARLRRRSDWVALNLIGCLPAAGEEVCVQPAYRLEPTEDLAEFARRRGVQEVIIAMDDRRRGFPAQALMSCRLEGILVSDMMAFYERHAGKIKTNLLHPSYIILSDGFSKRWSWRVGKRLLDFTSAALLLCLAWPFMLAAAIAIKYEEGWCASVFYRQPRVGQFGQPYTIIKFRSMRQEKGGQPARWAAKNDDRITRVGRVLRQCRIDELPQLFNVLRGDMSFVGPRPEQPAIVEALRENLAFYDLRHRVRPGITGWAQISYPYGASNEDSLEKLQFDLYYVKNGSLFLDLIIIMRTVEVVLFGKGAR